MGTSTYVLVVWGMGAESVVQLCFILVVVCRHVSAYWNEKLRIVSIVLENLLLAHKLSTCEAQTTKIL